MPGRVKPYDPEPFKKLLKELLSKSQESYRTISAAVGLSPTTLSSYMRGACPSRDACIVLSDHFGINPNEMLVAAGYEPLFIFDQALIDPEELSPDVKALAKELQKITDMERRRHAIDAIIELLRPDLSDPAASQESQED